MEQLDKENKINYQQAYQLYKKLQDDIFDKKYLIFQKY